MPKTGKKRAATPGDLHLRIPPDLYEIVKKAADLNRRSITGEILYALETTYKGAS